MQKAFEIPGPVWNYNSHNADDFDQFWQTSPQRYIAWLVLIYNSKVVTFPFRATVQTGEIRQINYHKDYMVLYTVGLYTVNSSEIHNKHVFFLLQLEFVVNSPACQIVFSQISLFGLKPFAEQHRIFSRILWDSLCRARQPFIAMVRSQYGQTFYSTAGLGSAPWTGSNSERFGEVIE